MVPSHYLNQCWNIVNLSLRNNLQWSFKRNSYIFIQENTFECVVCKMAAMLSQPQCVNGQWCNRHSILRHYLGHQTWGLCLSMLGQGISHYYMKPSGSVSGSIRGELCHSWGRFQLPASQCWDTMKKYKCINVSSPWLAQTGTAQTPLQTKPSQALELELELENWFDKYQYNLTTNLARNTIL